MNVNFDDIRAFMHVVDGGGISAAAARTGISKSILSGRLTHLEKSLKATLLQRSSRGTVLTEPGRRFYADMRDVIARMQHAVDDVAGGKQTALTGHLRIVAPTLFGSEQLGPIVFDLIAQHPELELTLDLDDHGIGELGKAYDLAIRVGEMADSSLMARRIAVCRRVLCCSPQYAKMHGKPRSIADIVQHECICHDRTNSASTWRFIKDRQSPEKISSISVRGRVRVSSPQSMRDAAVAGLGLAILPQTVAESFVRSGKLKIVLEQHPPVTEPIYAVYPRTHWVCRAIRVVVDTLADHFSTGAEEPLAE